MAGFTNKCPQCQTAIKIRSRDMDGKKARCPKCSTVFRIKAPPLAKATAAAKPESEEFSFLDKITDDDLGDYGSSEGGSPDGSSDELSEFDDDESLEASPSSRGDKSKKKRKDKQPVNSDFLIGGIVIGVGLLLFAALGTVGFKVLPKLLEQRSRLAYMPQDIETLFEIHPEQLWASRALRPLRETNFGVALRENMDKVVSPLKIDELDYIAVGFPQSGSNIPQPLMVFYALSRFDVPALSAQAKGFHEAEFQEQTYYFNKTDQRAAYFPEPDVMVYGTETHIHEAIKYAGICEAERFFDLPFRRTIVFATINASGYRNIGLTSLVGPGLLPIVKTQDLDTLTLAINVRSGVDVSAVLKYAAPEIAEQLVTTANEQIPETIDKLRFDRDERNKTDPSFKLNLGGAKGLMTGQIELLESFDVSQDKSSVEVSFEYPYSLIDSSMEMLALMGVEMLPDIGLMPELEEEPDPEVGDQIIEGVP